MWFDEHWINKVVQSFYFFSAFGAFLQPINFCFLCLISISICYPKHTKSRASALPNTAKERERRVSETRFAVRSNFFSTFFSFVFRFRAQPKSPLILLIFLLCNFKKLHRLLPPYKDQVTQNRKKVMSLKAKWNQKKLSAKNHLMRYVPKCRNRFVFYHLKFKFRLANCGVFGGTQFYIL